MKRNEQKQLQENFCGYCGCYCYCDATCGGNIKKCTSKKAKQKNCSHCCGCYMPLLIAKDFK